MQTSIIYLLGAGRSGTTLLATVLNSHTDIMTIGEMHQFFEHLEMHKMCSCGDDLKKCIFWETILSELELNEIQTRNNARLVELKEKHSNILKYLLNPPQEKEYSKIQEEVFRLVQKQNTSKWLLDSSKYIARFLLLKQNKKNKVKGIYIIRDIRGVINSFSKQVQTPKSPISTILYYSVINFFAQLTYWLNNDIIKIKYEDFVTNPEQVTNIIYHHIFENNKRVSLPNSFEMPHIIGGNRMKANTNITIKKDDNWKQNISRVKQISYYILTFPFMILNKYKI
ncbi:MAG: sulfotransferase [Urechidicola sp.]|nr:sulfotransferase [Urechidicola sp.]